MLDSGREMRQPDVEREFIAAPVFRRLKQQFVLRRKRTRVSQIDFDNLPPDTYVIYPDRLGNYCAPEILEVAVPVFSAEPMGPEGLRGASLNFFLRQSGEEAEIEPQPNPEVGTQGGAVISNSPTATLPKGEWNFLRPVVGYIAVGVLGGAIMFAIPALRRPAASLLPRGMADASESALTHSGGAAADTKPADNVTPKQSWANTVEASESHPAYDQHGLRGRFREQEQEVIVRHYDGRQPEVIRADSGVKRYSDWR